MFICALVQPLTGCESTNYDGQRSVLASAGPDDDEGEPEHSDVQLSLPDVSDSLQSANGPLTLKASRTGLNVNKSQYQIYLNRTLLENSRIQATPSEVIIPGPFVDGKNEIIFYATDSVGSPMEFDFFFWAGRTTVTGRVCDRLGNPVPNAEVSAALFEDLQVIAKASSTSSGTYTLSNLPRKRVLLSAIGPDGNRGTSIGVVGESMVDVVLPPMGSSREKESASPFHCLKK